MMKRVIGLCLIMLVSVSQSFAVLKIEITKGVDGASPIAIVPFAWEGKGKAPEQLAKIIAADLQRSGYFSALPEQDLIARPASAKQVKYADWRALNVDNLVVGSIKPLKDGTFQVRFQLLGIHKQRQLAGYSIRSRLPDLRRTAHQISDIIYKTVSGTRGAFDTHIAYITVTQDRKGKRRYRLAVADSDGHNEQIIYESSKPLLSPDWSPDGKRLAYVSFSRGRSEVYSQNILSRETKRLAAFQGINSAPVWSPDGKMLAMTLSKDGNPEIYVLTLGNNRLRRITRNYGIDTEPTWMPDSSALIFTSDRGGSPQLYYKELKAGSNKRVKRLTFEGKYNARASVSPDGKHVAMVHREDGKFRIAALELKTGLFRVLTDSRLDESPSFSPNGSMIIYATEDNHRGVLAAVSLDGRAHQRLSLRRGDVREPAWSAFKPE